METEEFDEEFRKKLLASSLEKAEQVEVDRIYRVVSRMADNSKRNSATFFLVYGLAAAMLIVSIGYIKYGRSKANDGFAAYSQMKNNGRGWHSKEVVKQLITPDSLARAQDTFIIKFPVGTDLAKPLKQTKQIRFVNKLDKIAEVEPKILRNISGPPPHTNQMIENPPNLVSTWQWPPNGDLLPVGHNLSVSTHPLIPTFAPDGISTPSTVSLEQLESGIKINLSSKIPRTSNPRFLVGIEMDAGMAHIGSSLIGEISFRRKWSIQTGIGWNHVKGARYHTAEQFTEQTGTNFRSSYAAGVDQEADLININQNYQLLRLPVILTYRHQLNPNWAFIVGAGTKFNVYSFGRTAYEYQKNNDPIGQKVHRSVVDGPVLNSISAMAGFERNWGPVRARLMPTIGCGLKTAAYERDLSIGTKIQLFYLIR